MVWPQASGAGILSRSQPVSKGRQQSHALPCHSLPTILFSVKVYGRDILKNLHIQHQQKLLVHSLVICAILMISIAIPLISYL